jgi:flagellar protein FlbD
MSIGAFSFRFSVFPLSDSAGRNPEVTRLSTLCRVNPFSTLPMFLSGAVCPSAQPRPAHTIEQGAERMIQLTRLNNKALMVNSDLIKFVEQSPDTLVTLITGEKIVVLERPEQVLARIIDFRRAVLQGLSPAWDASCSHSLLERAPGRSDPEPER